MNQEVVHNLMNNGNYVAMMTLSNISAVAQGIVSSDPTVPLIVSICTIAIPAVVGSLQYMAQRLVPLYINFIKERDQARSTTLSGKIDALMMALEVANDQAKASKELAATLEKNLENFKAMYQDKDRESAESRAKISEMNDQMKSMNENQKDLNKKLHELSDAATAATHRADIAERDKQELQNRIDELTAKIDVNSSVTLDTNEKVDDIKNRLPLQ